MKFHSDVSGSLSKYKLLFFFQEEVVAVEFINDHLLLKLHLVTSANELASEH